MKLLHHAHRDSAPEEAGHARRVCRAVRPQRQPSALARSRTPTPAHHCPATAPAGSGHAGMDAARMPVEPMRQLPGPRFTPPGRELVVIDTDGLETLCASPEDALAHMRSLIEDLAVRLARQYPDQDVAARRDARQRRPYRRRDPARRHAMSRFSRRDDRYASKRCACCGRTRCAGKGSGARSSDPTGPTSPTRRSAARSPGGSRSKASTRPAGRPDVGQGVAPAASDALIAKKAKKNQRIPGRGRANDDAAGPSRVGCPS